VKVHALEAAAAATAATAHKFQKANFIPNCNVEI
jgi:hypothetical protein